MKKLQFCFVLIFIACSAFGQQMAPEKPCSAPEASQFDFWVGDWELTWNDTSHGTNSIHKIMDGCTLQENFYDPAMNYSGSSWSVYNPRVQLWQQTWVDNNGGYIALTGNFQNNEMTLTTAPRKMKDGNEIISRMVFYNISAEKFDWRWESSTDKGASWKPNWVIHYLRKKA